jgi:hypothetical protein
VPEQTQLEDAAWGDLRSFRQSLVIELPMAGDWTADDKSTPWLVATHTKSHSMLRVRAWDAPRLTTPASCEEQARLWRPELLRVRESELLDRHELSAPPGFRGEVSVVVKPFARDGEQGIAGGVLAVGATTGRCLVVEFRTLARTTSGAEVISERLDIVTRGVLPRLRRLSAEDRAREAR